MCVVKVTVVSPFAKYNYSIFCFTIPGTSTSSKCPPAWLNLDHCCNFTKSDVTQGGRVNYSGFNFFHRVPRVSPSAYYC